MGRASILTDLSVEAEGMEMINLESGLPRGSNQD